MASPPCSREGSRHDGPSSDRRQSAGARAHPRRRRAGHVDRLGARSPAGGARRRAGSAGRRPQDRHVPARRARGLSLHRLPPQSRHRAHSDPRARRGRFRRAARARGGSPGDRPPYRPEPRLSADWPRQPSAPRTPIVALDRLLPRRHSAGSQGPRLQPAQPPHAGAGRTAGRSVGGASRLVCRHGRSGADHP